MDLAWSESVYDMLKYNFPLPTDSVRVQGGETTSCTRTQGGNVLQRGQAIKGGLCVDGCEVERRAQARTLRHDLGQEQQGEVPHLPQGRPARGAGPPTRRGRRPRPHLPAPLKETPQFRRADSMHSPARHQEEEGVRDDAVRFIVWLCKVHRWHALRFKKGGGWISTRCRDRVSGADAPEHRAVRHRVMITSGPAHGAGPGHGTRTSSRTCTCTPATVYEPRPDDERQGDFSGYIVKGVKNRHQEPGAERLDDEPHRAVLVDVENVQSTLRL